LLYVSKYTIIKAYKDTRIKFYGSNEFYEPYTLSKKTDEKLKIALTVVSRPLEFVRLDLIFYNKSGYLGYLYTLYFINILTEYY
ncbi:hypothetical protein QBC39DRAFT_266228, partial [Podospora conica]